MELNEYQKKAKETALYPDKYKVIHAALGLNGESGEIADKIKKVLRKDEDIHNMPQEFIDDMKKEIGDVLWYVATLADDFGLELEDIAETNIKKLADRKDRGVIHSTGDNR